MNPYLRTSIMVVVLAITSHSLPGQVENKELPRWVSGKGYWVIEGNINDPLRHIIWFYNNDNLLVYKETLTGIKLNCDRRKVKMKLRKVLESSIIAWENKKVAEENKQYVAAILQ